MLPGGEEKTMEGIRSGRMHGRVNGRQKCRSPLGARRKGASPGPEDRTYQRKWHRSQDLSENLELPGQGIGWRRGQKEERFSSALLHYNNPLKTLWFEQYFIIAHSNSGF